MFTQFNVAKMLFEKESTEMEIRKKEIRYDFSYSYFQQPKWRQCTYLETPILPNVRVLDISGRMHARSFRCSGCRIQSSQNL